LSKIGVLSIRAGTSLASAGSASDQTRATSLSAAGGS
jgi:hypothetical protein